MSQIRPVAIITSDKNASNSGSATNMTIINTNFLLFTLSVSIKGENITPILIFIGKTS